MLMDRGPSCCMGAALTHAAPRQLTPGQGHPAEQVKKQEDVKSCLCWSVTEGNEGKIYS